MKRINEPITSKDVTSQITSKYSIERNTFKREINSNPKDRVELERGDIKEDNYMPQDKHMRWDNEVNVSRRAPIDPDAVVETEGEKIKYIAPDGYEVHQYEKPEGDELELHFRDMAAFLKRATVTPDGKNYRIVLTTQYKNVKAYKQLPLTIEEAGKWPENYIITETDVFDENGNSVVHRPDNVVNSLAFYHVSKGGLNRADGMEYKAGKVGHQFRIKLIDKNGNWIWADQNWLPESNEIELLLPKEWVDTCTFDLTVDPTFGYTSAGASNLEFYGNQVFGDGAKITGGDFNLSEDGDISKLTVHVATLTASYSDITVFGGIFSPGTTLPNERVGDSVSQSGITSTGWKDLTYGSPLTLTAGNHKLCTYADVDGAGNYDAMHVSYDSGGSNAARATSTGVTNASQMGDTLTNDGSGDGPVYVYSTVTNTQKVSIYATYTPDPGSSDAVVCALPGTAGQDATIGTIDWADQSNITALDSNRASANAVRVSGAVTDESVKLINGGSIAGNDKTLDTTLLTAERSYGGPTDTWGLTLSASDVNASNFGVGFSMIGNGGTSKYLTATNFGFSIPTGATIDGIEVFVNIYNPAGTPSVDSIEMCVYYTESSTASVSPVTTTLTVPSVTPTYIQSETATVSPVSISATIPSVTATYDGTYNASVTPVALSLTTPSVTATQPNQTLSIDSFVLAFSLTATVSPVLLTLALPAITATYTQVDTATVSPKTLTLTIPSVTATSVSQLTASVAPVGLTLTPPTVTAGFTISASVTPVVITTAVPSVTAGYDGASVGVVSSVSLTLSTPSVTATYAEIDTATVNPVTTTLTTPTVTATHQITETAIVSPVSVSIVVPSVTPTYDYIQTASVSPISLSLTLPSVTGTYSGAGTASVSPVVITTILPTVTGTYVYNATASVSPVGITVSIPSVIANTGGYRYKYESHPATYRIKYQD